MTQIRPVDCSSKTPLTFTPGYVDKVIYDDGVPHAGQHSVGGLVLRQA